MGRESQDFEGLPRGTLLSRAPVAYFYEPSKTFCQAIQCSDYFRNGKMLGTKNRTPHRETRSCGIFARIPPVLETAEPVARLYMDYNADRRRECKNRLHQCRAFVLLNVTGCDRTKIVSNCRRAIFVLAHVSLLPAAIIIQAQSLYLRPAKHRHPYFRPFSPFSSPVTPLYALLPMFSFFSWH